MAARLDLSEGRLDTYSYNQSLVVVHHPCSQRDEYLKTFAECLGAEGEGVAARRILSRAHTGQVRSSWLRGLYWRCLAGVFPLEFADFGKAEKWYVPEHAKYAHEAVNGADIPASKEADPSKDEEPALSLLRRISKKATQMRENYRKMKHEAFSDPDEGEEDLDVCNPLSEAVENPWHSYFRKSELEKTIRQDIIRLHLDNDFLMEDDVRRVITQVLVLWCMENQNLGYRQGMHEVAAALFLIIARDSRQRFFEANPDKVPTEEAAKGKATPAPKSGGGGEGDQPPAADGEGGEGDGEGRQNEPAEAPEGEEGGEGGEAEEPYHPAMEPKVEEPVQQPQRADWSEGFLSEVDKGLDNILDMQHLESDCYYLFDAFMNKLSLQDWYQQTKDEGPRRPQPDQGALGGAVGGGTEDKSKEVWERSAVVMMGNKIQNTLLKQWDPYISKKLDSLEIEPQLYSLRWLRLLFLREFHMEDCFIVWDALLADSAARGTDFTNLVPHVGLAMLRFLRDNILPCDYSQVVSRLMRFPPCDDVLNFIRAACSTRYAADDFLHTILVEPPPKPVAPAPPPDIIAAVKPLSKVQAPPSLNSPPPSASGSPTQPPKPVLSELDALKAQQNRMGTRLEKIIDVMQNKWFTAPGRVSDSSEGEAAQLDESYLLAIAELKKVKDILIGRIEEEEDEEC